MNIHEYQAKELLSRKGITVPLGGVARTVQQAQSIARDLGGDGWVVKAQIHASGRGTGRFRDAQEGRGGVRFAKTVDEVAKIAGEMLGNVLVTKQTSGEGRRVEKVYVEQQRKVEREIYLAIFVDRQISRVTLIASPHGGVNVETLVKQAPQSLLRMAVDPVVGLQSDAVAELVADLNLTGKAAVATSKVIATMYEMFTTMDASLIEVNPLGVDTNGDVVALDAKMTFDDNALFRHPEVAELRDDHQFGLGELEAQQHGFNYIKLDGNIGCMTCGAGLAMAIIDAIKQYGGAPANFLDMPPVTQVDRAKDALKLVLSDPAVESILINVFGGGIMSCDTIADSIILTNREQPIQVPLVVRLVGTNADYANRRLRDSGPEVIFADNLADAAEKAVTAAAQAKLTARRTWWERVQGLVSKQAE